MIYVGVLRDSSISRSALTSGFFRRYEKSPGFGFENDKVRSFGGKGGFDGPSGRGPDVVFENFRSLFDVKKRGRGRDGGGGGIGPALQGAVGS